MGTLILIRHGESLWNQENRFTGWVDIALTPKGTHEAYIAGTLLKNIPMQIAFTSILKRAIDTTSEVLQGAEQPSVPVIKSAALNERMYGDLQGLNKTECAERYGAELVHQWRRSYDVQPPGGESLLDTANRALPYFESQILPHAISGENVLISAHGNSLRAIVMMLDKLNKEQVLQLNIPNAIPLIYQIGDGGEVLSKRVLTDEFEKALSSSRA